ncbi:acyl carrier protein [Streptomyces sp. NBRC 110028]|uniref:acyl carrier protein n=1 Tax=Streptomyces sp. NBRC 110028 TaxID=1621260 RepID=UPI0006E1D9C2|nr:acyl carrier protein [Streptomyces sp. NBRC 110028]
MARSTGPCYTVACGCSSAAVQIGNARRLIATGEVEMAAVTGVDVFDVGLIRQGQRLHVGAQRAHEAMDAAAMPGLAPPEEIAAGSATNNLPRTPPGLARRAALEAYLTGHIRVVLRLSSTTLDPQTPLRSLGFDSLLAMELRGRLETGLNIKLAGNFVWQHPTVAALAVGLAQHVGLELTAQQERLSAYCRCAVRARW